MEVLAHTRYTKRLSLITTAVAALITFLLLMTYQYLSGVRQLDQEVHSKAAIIATNSAAALVFGDHKAAYENLSAIRKAPRILGAAIYQADGRLFTLIDDPLAKFPDTIDPDSSDVSDGKNELFSDFVREEITQDGTRVGSLLLLATRKPLYLNLLAYAGGLFVIGLIALIRARRFTASLRKKMALTEGQLEQMALYDRVTGLPNRRFFEYELKKAITRVKREGENAALLTIDVDDFKKVNDLCGHPMGDKVLEMIAVRLKSVIRADDILARVGGDEFAAILFMVGEPENIDALAEKMIAAMEAPFPTEPIPSHIGLSIGMTMMPGDSDDPETLISWSDMAMYEAKAQGKNRAQFFSEDINRKIRANLHVEAALHQALKTDAGELYVAYQPQICAQTRRIVGVEALTRWTRPDGKPLSPAEFIPVAEKTGLIVDLGAWLIRQVCSDLSWLRQQGINIDKVAINVSPRELTRGNAIVENACRTIQQFKEQISCFQFEITENALMAERGADVLDAFHRSGFSLAIDDFGTGYSSLGYLKRFQISTLKIDQSFIKRLPSDANDAAIVSAVIRMAKALGISLVAEGVETDEQAQFLTSHGCDVLQGYLFSRPLPREDLAVFIAGHSTTDISGIAIASS